MRIRSLLCAAAAAGLVGSAFASDGLRVAAWNITNYNGGFATEVKTAVYESFEGRQLAPDVFLLQEFSSQSALALFVGHLNTAVGSPGDWVGAPMFVNGSINTALVYRSSTLDLLDSTLVAPGSSSTNPRNIVRYDMRLKAYSTESATIAFYSTHMKAGNSSSDQNRRLIEAQRIVADLANLPAERHFVLGGDFNTQSSSQASFVALVGAPYNSGPFVDPITAPGSWQNNSTFRMIHTQDPAGQMDDRYDIILLAQSMVDGVGLDYIGDFSTPWNLSRWDDPNHSYRAWGNDGTTYNTVLRTVGNQHVSPAIAQALITTAGNTGHIPLYLDLRVPAKLFAVDTPVDLGTITPTAQVDFDLTVGSAGDTTKWGAGIEETQFLFTPGPGVDAPSGFFTDAAGGALPSFSFTLDAGAFGVGPVSTFVDIVSNDDARPTVRVPVVATIAAAGCNPADLAAPFGQLTFADISAFLAAFTGQDPAADLAAPAGQWTFADISAFLAAFSAGCP